MVVVVSNPCQNHEFFVCSLSFLAIFENSEAALATSPLRSLSFDNFSPRSCRRICASLITAMVAVAYKRVSRIGYDKVLFIVIYDVV